MPVIHLVPADGAWWFARWQGDHVAIDLCTPTTPSGGGREVWSYDDLELDLHKFRDGRWGVTDEDEFLEAHFDGFIDDDELRTSLDTAHALRERLRAGDEVFDRLGWQKLDRWIERDLAPLTDFPD